MLENESRQMDGVQEKLDITKYVKAHLGLDPEPPENTEQDNEEVVAPSNPVVPPTEDDFEYIKLISNGAYG